MRGIHFLRPRLVRPAHSLAMAILCCFAMPPAKSAAEFGPPVDLTATSPDGRFKADATVASNGCKIEVRAMPAGNLLWSAEHEGFLAELILTDAGGLLTRSYPALSYVYYSATGRPGPRFELGTEIPPDERTRFCGETTRSENQIYNYLVRDIWVEGSHSWIYFRTYWGQIVTLDCATGALDRNPALGKRIEDTLLHEAESWIAAAPATFRGTPSTLAPYLADKVTVHLFVIRAHRLKAGEPYVAAAMNELRGDQFINLRDCLDSVYDPSTPTARLKDHPLLIVLVLFTTFLGIVLLLKRIAIKRQQARATT